MKAQRIFSTLLGVATIVAMASLSWVGAASAAPAPSQTINISDQNCCDTGEIMVNSVTAAQDGWIGIFKDSTATMDELMGYAPVHQGQNVGFTADIDSQRVGDAATLYAALLVDTSGTGVFDVSTVALAPNTPIVAFATQATPQPAAPAATPASSAPVTQGNLTDQINIKAQNCCDTGEVVIDSVTAAQDGWIGIFKDANASMSELVGYTPLHQGQNVGLTADIDSQRVGDAATLYAALLVDTSGTGVFDVSTVALAPGTPIIAFATQPAP